METLVERRKEPRSDLKWPVSIFIDGDTIDGESRNITVNGVYICCEKPLRLNDTYRMLINPPHHQALDITGKVIWSDLYGLDKEMTVYCVGLCFVEISKEERVFLNDLISTDHNSK